MSTADIAEAARIATTGDYRQRLSKLNLADRQVPIRVRLDAEALSDEAMLALMRVPSANGGTVPLSAVALVWRMAPDGVVSPERLRHRLLREKRPKDVVLLRNGDTLEGTLVAIKEGRVDLDVGKKTASARWARACAARRRARKGTRGRLSRKPAALA